jgi:hypothetical protein
VFEDPVRRLPEIARIFTNAAPFNQMIEPS